MGTSLSGLTPATTFDGLLKVGDNDPLTADLKAISTGDGTDTMLELSTSALQIGGATGMYWDNTNKRLGIGTDSPSTPLQVNGAIRSSGTGTQSFEFSAASLAQFRAIFGSVGFRVGSGMFIGGTDGGPAASTRLHVKGSGATSATTSLLVQNSAGSDLLKVQDDGLVNIIGTNNDYDTVNFQIQRSTGESIFRARNRGALEIGSGIDWVSLNSSGLGVRLNVSNSEIARVTASGVGIGETTPTARLHVKGSGNSSATNAFFVENSTGNDLFRVVDNGLIYMSNDNYIFSNSQSQFNNKLGIGTTPDSSTQLHIKGSSASPATNALLVQNSAGSESFKVRDDGFVAIQGNNILVSKSASLATTSGTKVYVGNTTADSKLAIKGNGNDATTTALLVQNSDGGDLLTLTDDGALQINSDATERFTIANANGNAALNFRYNNIYTSGGNVLYISGASTIISGGGSERLRTSPTGTTIKGSGTTSATTALLVENSAGTDLFKVDDSGASVFSGQTIFQNNVKLQGANDTSTLNNLRFVVPGSAKSLTINKDYSFTNDASALVDIQSTTQGFLPPRMTDAERDAIATPAAGLMIYDTTNNQMNYWNGSTWIAF